MFGAVLFGCFFGPLAVFAVVIILIVIVAIPPDIDRIEDCTQDMGLDILELPDGVGQDIPGRHSGLDNEDHPFDITGQKDGIGHGH